MADASPDRTADRLVARLVEDGQYEAALSAVQKHLFDAPHDGEALNEAGVILHALGHFEEAAEHLKRAIANLDSARAAEAMANLAEVYLSARRPGDAEALLDGLAHSGALSPDLANRTANCFLELKDTAGAVEALLHSLNACPSQPVPAGVVGKLRALRPKVGILQPGRPGKTLACVQEYLARRFEVRVFHNDGTEELARMLHGCDIAWFEDCSPALAIASKAAKRWRIICRLRLEGAYSPWVEQVRWENVDVLIAPPNQAVLGYLRQRIPDLDRRTRLALVPDGVDTARFAFSDRPQGRNLACIGPLDMRHNPMFLLQCFLRLLEAHGPYRLAFAGMFTDDKVEHYLTNMVAHMGLSAAVSFEGFQEDLPVWLADKHYVVSAEVAAIQPTSVLEAMACGLRPVVHHFPGAEDFLDRRHLFATPEEFCRQIAEESYAPAKYRDTVTERFALKDQLGAIGGILRELEKAPLPKAGPGPSAQTGAFVKE